MKYIYTLTNTLFYLPCGSFLNQYNSYRALNSYVNLSDLTGLLKNNKLMSNN